MSSGIVKKNAQGTKKMSTKRQTRNDLTAFHCRLPRPIKDKLMDAAQSRQVSAAMVLTDLIDGHLGKPAPIATPTSDNDDQLDVIDWLQRNA